MESLISSVAELEAQVGTPPSAVNLKVIDHLDAQAVKWLAASPLAFAGFSSAAGLQATLAGGTRGFAQAITPNELCLRRAALDDARFAAVGDGVGLLFLIPGLGETLRVNGTVQYVDDELRIQVHECYAHCAKALLRSDFWLPGSVPAYGDVDAFLQHARFLALATADAQGRTDLSPKGDPAGCMVQSMDGGIRYADRPGNRRTDSFRNILSRPQAAAVLLVPGCTQVAMLRGDAQIRADLASRQAFAVQDKVPKLVTELRAAPIVLRHSAALARARPWAGEPAPVDIDPAQMFAAHVKLHQARGLGAALARTMVSIPGVMRKGLEQDYKRNLY